MGHAIFRQKSGILGVAVATKCGVVTPDQLVAMGVLPQLVKVHGIKMTTRQTMVFLIDENDLAAFKAAIEDMGLTIGVFGNVVRNVKGCAGSDQLCPRSLGDAYGLGVKIQEMFMNQPTPKDFKISTAGCVRGCTDPYCADFGAICVGADTFDVYIGGRGGSKSPRHGQCLMRGASSAQVIAALKHVLEQYRQLAQPDERLCRVIDRVGLDPFMAPAAAASAAPPPAAGLSDDFLSFIEEKEGEA